VIKNNYFFIIMYYLLQNRINISIIYLRISTNSNLYYSYKYLLIFNKNNPSGIYLFNFALVLKFVYKDYLKYIELYEV
jgi:hypothetical protein